MRRMNMTLPFRTLKRGADSFENSGFLSLLNKEIDGEARLRVYHYDQNATDKKGKLLYGVKATSNGRRVEAWDEVVHSGYFSNVTVKSTDIQNLITVITPISPYPECTQFFEYKKLSGNALQVASVVLAATTAIAVMSEAAVAAGLIALASPLAVPSAIFIAIAGEGLGYQFIVGLSTSIASEIGLSKEIFLLETLPKKCFSQTVFQPVIIELTIKNATVNAFKIPGPSTDFDLLTPRDMFVDEVIWARTVDSALPTMVLEQHKLEIRGNQTKPTSSNEGIEEVVMEVWGKMLVHSEIEDEKKPEINPEYDYSLWVANGLVSEDFHILPIGSWADYVFKKGYELPDLSVLNAYIKKHKHLPEIPSIKDLENNGGYTQHNFNVKLLEKIEMLTLYKIQQNAKVSDIASIIAKSRKTLKEYKQTHK
jgi:hypothetical protein